MGYLKIDNSATGGPKFETDTTHCRHCQAVIDKRKWVMEGGTWACSKCKGPVCPTCSEVRDSGNNLICTPWEERIENTIRMIEERDRRFGRSAVMGGIVL